MIAAEDAFERMGADVMRWQFCRQPPDRNLLFGYGPAHEIKRRLLTLWNSVKFLVDYGTIEGFQPRYEDLAGVPDLERPLDRWLVARTDQLVQEATAALEEQLTFRLIDAFERYVDDLSNWYIRRSRRRFWDGDEAALRVLWYGIVQALRVMAPVMPFLAEHLWQNLVRGACEDAPDSLFLAGWPEVGEPDAALLEEVAQVRLVVELGRQARSASGLKLRQPLRRLHVWGAPLAESHAAEIEEELRVKEADFTSTPLRRVVSRKLNLPLLGRRLGSKIPELRQALDEGAFTRLDDADGGYMIAGERLSEAEIIEESGSPPGWAVAEEAGTGVALQTEIDDELRLEGRVLDLIHQLNSMRKDAGLELTDRITVTLPAAQADLLAHADWIKGEVLAVEIEADGGGGEPSIAKV
jgi:isoleucyl-tRNA synthetase